MRTFEIRMKFWIIFINLNYCGKDFPITFQLLINKNICPRLCQCKKKTSRIHSDGCSEFVWSCSDRKLIENKAGTVLLIFVRLPGAFVCVHSIFNQRHWRWRMYEVIFFSNGSICRFVKMLVTLVRSKVTSCCCICSNDKWNFSNKANRDWFLFFARTAFHSNMIPMGLFSSFY